MLKPAIAQGNEVVSAGFVAIDERLATVGRLIEFAAESPAWDLDGLFYRVDEEILALHGDLATLGSTARAHEGDAPVPAEIVAALAERVNRAQTLSADRVEAITARIAREITGDEEFSGSPQSIISRAFVQDLRGVRLRHLTALLDGFRLQEDLGLPGRAGEREAFEEQLELASERLVGQIRLDALTLTELRNRIVADPTDESVRAATRAVEHKHAGNLDALAGLITLKARAQNDVRELRTLQAQQRGLMGADVLDSTVFARLFADRLDALRETLIVSGPKWVLRALAFFAVLLTAFLLARAVRSVARYVMLHRSVELGDLRERTIVSLAYGTVLAVGFVLALSALGVSLVPLMAGLGVASIIVGLALQESLGNFAAGGMILLTRPFDLHDKIRIGDAEGQVRDMSLVATTVASHDNKMLVIPNRQVWNSTILNFTRAKLRRVDVQAAVPRGSDLALVERVLRDAVEAEQRVLTEPGAKVELGEFGESTVSYWVRVWVETGDVGVVSAALKRHIAERMRDEGMGSSVQIS